MSSAFADPFSRRPLTTARSRRVGVVVADASSQKLADALLARALRRWDIVPTGDISLLATARPDAIVLLADFTAASGVSALRRIRDDVPGAHMVVVARDDGNAIAARQALNAGAEAFVPADEADRLLAPALDAVLAGFICAPRAARRVLAKPTFSHREKEVLELLIAGLTNRQIGGRLFLAESTVKTHLASAFAKLGVRSRKDAVARLLDPDEGLAATALPPAGESRLQ